MAPSPLGLTPEIAVVPDALPIHQSTHACYPPGMPNLCSFPFLVHVTRGNIGLLPLPYERPLELPTYPWVRRRTQGIAPLSSGKSSLGPPILGHLHMETRHTPLGRFGFCCGLSEIAPNCSSKSSKFTATLAFGLSLSDFTSTVLPTDLSSCACRCGFPTCFWMPFSI